MLVLSAVIKRIIPRDGEWRPCQRTSSQETQRHRQALITVLQFFYTKYLSQLLNSAQHIKVVCM